jgi:ATP-dependent Clp protease ATP-binding subunit ClpB
LRRRDHARRVPQARGERCRAARRFQPVFVGEPSVADTISILRGIKEKYETHHGVRITDGALVAAATLSNRYITDRFLPDKAIDLMDEAASRLRMEVDSKPEELDELDRRVIQLKIEREALKRESDAASRDRLDKLEKELAELEEKSNAMTAAWHAEKDKLADTQKLKERLDQARSAPALVRAQTLATSSRREIVEVRCGAALNQVTRHLILDGPHTPEYRGRCGEQTRTTRSE